MLPQLLLHLAKLSVRNLTARSQGLGSLTDTVSTTMSVLSTVVIEVETGHTVVYVITSSVVYGMHVVRSQLEVETAVVDRIVEVVIVTTW